MQVTIEITETELKLLENLQERMLEAAQREVEDE